LDNSSSQPISFTDRLRPAAAVVLQPIARGLMRLGFTANALTLLGLLLAVSVGLAAALGSIVLAGFLMLLSGPMDALDGTLARLSDTKNKFGAFFDSTADRYAEGFVLIGLSIYGLSLHDNQIVLLSFVAFWGSVMVSYTRARAEGLGLECKVGLFTRMERFVLVTAMLILNQVLPGLILLAALTHITALQRVFHIWHATRTS
jgi:CDP-diacylglycerol--glycerol-3-phosphate 3-phosphatidyltransferase